MTVLEDEWLGSLYCLVLVVEAPEELDDPRLNADYGKAKLLHQAKHGIWNGRKSTRIGNSTRQIMKKHMKAHA
jgi:hypothetical protein